MAWGGGSNDCVWGVGGWGHLITMCVCVGGGLMIVCVCVWGGVNDCVGGV